MVVEGAADFLAQHPEGPTQAGRPRGSTQNQAAASQTEALPPAPWERALRLPGLSGAQSVEPQPASRGPPLTRCGLWVSALGTGCAGC